MAVERQSSPALKKLVAGVYALRPFCRDKTFRKNQLIVTYCNLDGDDEIIYAAYQRSVSDWTILSMTFS